MMAAARTFRSPTTDARGVITTYTYDTLNRPYQVVYNVGSTGVPATSILTYTFGTNAASNNNGRLITMSDGTGAESYSYDILGRMTQLQKTIGSTPYTVGYAYNLANQLTSTTYPSGRTVQQSYDAIGRLCAIAGISTNCTTNTVPYATGFGYNTAFQLTGFNYGNGVVASLGYSPDRQQLTTLAYTKSPQTLFSVSYSYAQTGGNDGQIAKITDSVDNGRTATYGYDALNRLTSASTVGSAGYAAWSLAFTYDRYGNRTNQSGTLNSLTPTGITTNQMTSDTYDANGNLTVENTTPNNGYQYDAENRLIGYSSGGATVATYAFDGNNLRVQKTQGSTVTTYIFSGGKVIAEYAGSTLSKEYVYAGSQLLATIAGGTTTYHHVDHLSVRLTTDSTGAKIGEQGHYPFGEQWYANSTTTKWQFTGYERDAESGNDYAMFRYYSNRTGRFLPPDPAGLAAVDPSDPQSWNQYAYGLNDPIDLVDPLGLCPAPGVYSKKCVYVQRIGGSYNCSVDGAMTDCGLAFSLIATGAAYPTSTPDGQQCYQINDQIYCGTLQRVPDVGVVFNGSKFDPIAYLSSLFPVSVDGSTNNQSTSADCRYVDPGSAGIEITFKVGAAVEAGPVSVGLNEFTKTLGEKGMGSSIEFGVKGILSLQGKRDNAYSSGPMSWTLSAFGFAKDLRTPFFSSSGWTFQPAKEFKIGIQLIGGVEIGYNSEKAKQQDERNIACGYKNGPPGNHYHF